METRREYQLKATKLDYRYIELKQLDFIQLELHANYRYEIVSEDKAYQFIGRFNPDGKVQVKVPAKWASAKSWQLNAQAVEDDFVAKIFPKLVNPTWTLQDRNNAVMMLASGGLIGGVTGYLYGDQIKETVLENLPRITGAAQVASGIMSLYVAGVVGVTGVGAPLAAAIGFVALDNIQAGARSIWTNEHTPTYGGELIEWSGLLPKGYGEIAYSLVDIGLVGKAASVLKTATQTQNVIKLQTTKAVKVGQTIKPTEMRISVEKITTNQHHIIELKNADDVAEEFVKYRRVQGGIGFKSSQERIIINESGNLYIKNKNANLNISTDNGEHAKYFLGEKRSNAYIIEFDIPKWLDDLAKESAIPQFEYKSSPYNQGGLAPKVTDTSTPGTSIEFPPPWIEWIEEHAKNATIIKGN